MSRETGPLRRRDERNESEHEQEVKYDPMKHLG